MVEKKIALFVPSLRGGGAERIMVSLANSFAERGLLVDLVLAQASGPYMADVSPRVRIVDLHARRVLTSLPRLVSYLRKSRPQAMLSTLRHANVVAFLANTLAGSRTRLVLREANHVDASRFPGLGGRFQLWLYRQAYRRADAVVGISRGVRDAVQHLTGRTTGIYAIHNPIEVDRIIELAGAPVDEWVMNLPRPLVVAVGRLTPQKDFATLIKAFAELRGFMAAHLLILGEGSDRSALERLVDERGLNGNVSMPGFVGNPFAIMKQADLFVLSSRWEGFGNVLVEAMACGLPVVSTDCKSGPAEILEDGRWGRLVPVGDATALAEAMQERVGYSGINVRLRTGDFELAKTASEYLSLLGIKGVNTPSQKALD